MKFKEFLKNLFASIKDGVSRFFMAFICSSLFFLTLTFVIIFETNNDSVLVPLCMTYCLIGVLSVLLKTTEEYICDKIDRSIQYTVCIIMSLLAFYLIKSNYESLYTLMAYVGIIIALLCFIFFVIMRGENRDASFPKIVSSFVFATAICIVLSTGLSTCIAAFQFLIYSWDNFYKIYLVVNLFVWSVGFVNIFLALVPKKDIPIAQQKIFRTLVLFITLPLYILLITILLIYLAKIVITRNMPVGEINWFASFASLFFIFIVMSVMQYTEKLARIFVKYGGYFLIPVLIMQSIAVFERIAAYGLTTPRTISLVLIVISILFIIGTMVIPKHLNKIALTSGVIALIVTITPFNVIDMPISSQTKILRTTLEANGMLNNGVVIPNENVSKDDAERIISAFEYLKYDADNVPDFIQNSDDSPKEIFGFSNSYESEYIYCSYKTKDSVDISAYTKMISVYENNNYLVAEYNNESYEVDLKQIAKDLYALYGANNSNLEIYTIDENTGLYFDHINFEIDNDEVMHCYFNGFILFK